MLSMWKIDNLGISKIKGQYFSIDDFPKEKRERMATQSGSKMVFSLDG